MKEKINLPFVYEQNYDGNFTNKICKYYGKINFQVIYLFTVL